MSRIGKKVRLLPPGVTAELAGPKLSVRGPRGELTLMLPARVEVAMAGSELRVAVAAASSQRDRALWGTYSSLIANLITGVTTGYQKQLEINGVGFKASLKGSAVLLAVGFTHPVEIAAPAGIAFNVEKNIITVTGSDKQLEGETAARIRRIWPPEPYKGKGIKYLDEVIKRKAGKTAAKSAA